MCCLTFNSTFLADKWPQCNFWRYSSWRLAGMTILAPFSSKPSSPENLSLKSLSDWSPLFLVWWWEPSNWSSSVAHQWFLWLHWGHSELKIMRPSTFARGLVLFLKRHGESTFLKYRSDPDNSKWFITTSLFWIKQILQIKINAVNQTFPKNLI